MARKTPERGASPRQTAPGTRRLTHVTRTRGRSHASLVDVGAKPVTARRAVARALLVFPSGSAVALLARGGPKGPVEDVARAAAVLAVKRTSDLIPLCHPLPIDAIELAFAARGKRTIEVRCTVGTSARTGVEMEALVGAAVAALTVYDMTKALDHGIVIERVELCEKRGGRSGTWTKGGPSSTRPAAHRGEARPGRARGRERK